MYFVVLMFAALLGLMVYRYDKYEKEPWYLLMLAIALGAGAGWLIGHVEDFIIAALCRSSAEFGLQASFAAFLEEGIKLLCVVLLAMGIVKHFREPMDGLIYGSFVGLGFALIEFMIYQSFMLRDDQIRFHVMGGEAVRFVFHTLTSGLCGFGVGLAKFRLPGATKTLIGCTSAVILVHFLWDFHCGLPSQSVESWWFQRTVAIGLVVSTLLMYGTAVSLALRLSQEMHPMHAPVSLWGWPFSRWVREAR